MEAPNVFVGLRQSAASLELPATGFGLRRAASSIFTLKRDAAAADGPYFERSKFGLDSGRR
jgi:hypothetical protein